MLGVSCVGRSRIDQRASWERVSPITNHISINDPANRMLTIHRVFNAPRQLVFETFVDPKHVLHWLGPREHPATHFEADVRPGGAWREHRAESHGRIMIAKTLEEGHSCGTFALFVRRDRYKR